MLCLISELILMAVFGFKSFDHVSHAPPANYTVINSVLITLGAIIGIVLLANVYTWMRAVVRLAVPTRKQVWSLLCPEIFYYKQIIYFVIFCT